MQGCMRMRCWVQETSAVMCCACVKRGSALVTAVQVQGAECDEEKCQPPTAITACVCSSLAARCCPGVGQGESEGGRAGCRRHCRGCSDTRCGGNKKTRRQKRTLDRLRTADLKAVLPNLLLPNRKMRWIKKLQCHSRPEPDAYLCCLGKTSAGSPQRQKRPPRRPLRCHPPAPTPPPFSSFSSSLLPSPPPLLCPLT